MVIVVMTVMVVVLRIELMVMVGYSIEGIIVVVLVKLQLISRTILM